MSDIVTHRGTSRGASQGPKPCGQLSPQRTGDTRAIARWPGVRCRIPRARPGLQAVAAGYAARSPLLEGRRRGVGPGSPPSHARWSPTTARLQRMKRCRAKMRRAARAKGPENAIRPLSPEEELRGQRHRREHSTPSGSLHTNPATAASRTPPLAASQSGNLALPRQEHGGRSRAQG